MSYRLRRSQKGLLLLERWRGIGRVEMNDAALEGDGDGVGAIFCSELAEDALHVGLDGARSGAEEVGDFLIAEAAGNQADHFDFTRGEGNFGKEAVELLGDLKRNVTLAGEDGADGTDDFGVHHVLEQVASDAGL